MPIRRRRFVMLVRTKIIYSYHVRQKYYLIKIWTVYIYTIQYTHSNNGCAFLVSVSNCLYYIYLYILHGDVLVRIPRDIVRSWGTARACGNFGDKVFVVSDTILWSDFVECLPNVWYELACWFASKRVIFIYNNIDYLPNIGGSRSTALSITQ